MRNFSLSLSLLLTVFCLAGCKSVFNPSWMPSGYAYTNNLYKGQPGPEAADIGYEYTDVENAAVMARWDKVAGQLVSKLQEQSGMQPADIHVHSKAGDAFYAGFDDALRKTLRERGFILVNDPGATYALDYEAVAQGPAGEMAKPAYNGDMPSPAAGEMPVMQDFLLILRLKHEGVLLGEGAGTYEMPVFGYASSSRASSSFGATPSTVAFEGNQ